MQLREEVHEELEVVVGSCEVGLVELEGGSVEEGETAGGKGVLAKALAGDGGVWTYAARVRRRRERLGRWEGGRKGKAW